MDRAPRFRPTTMVDEWPFARPQSRANAIAQRDHLKEVLYEDTAAASKPDDKQQPLCRRDPNRQSDPVQADEQHAWNRCGIKKVEQPNREDHVTSKKMMHQQTTTLSDWSGRQPTQQEIDTARASRQSSPESVMAASAASSSAARRRAKAQNQGRVGDLLTLTAEDPFSGKTAPCDIGPQVGVSRPARSGKQLNSSQTLMLKMAALARATGRCASALWQSCLEGHILKRPFNSAPALHPQQQQMMMSRMSHSQQRDEDNDGTSSEMSTSSTTFGGDRMRRTVPFLEVVMQLEDALDCDISELALAELLGLGHCVEQTPVRYQHFLRIFNA